jgi:hypothetical protein
MDEFDSLLNEFSENIEYLKLIIQHQDEIERTMVKTVNKKDWK